MSRGKKVLAMFFGAALLVWAGAAHSEELPVLRVGHVGHDHQIALYVAADAGQSLEKQYGVYFEKLKDQEAYILHDGGRAVAQVRMVRVGGGAKMPAALEQGDIEVGLGGLGPVAKFVDKGTGIKVLAPLNNDGDALVLGRTMKANSWDEFVREVKSMDRQVRIGYKDPMAVAYMILVRALQEEGITYGQEPLNAAGVPNKVILINMQGLSNAVPSLDSGIVDGVVVNEPMPSMLVYKKAGRVVADLSELPPHGKWEGHPCCVVAATDKALSEKRAIIKSLLKAIAAGNDIIARDKEAALRSEMRWTRSPEEVGRNSIKNVDYVAVPDSSWLDGVDTWLELMTNSGHFKKDLMGKDDQQIRDSLMDLGPIREALEEMKLRQKE